MLVKQRCDVYFSKNNEMTAGFLSEMVQYVIFFVCLV